ncbi:MAG: hypothetical protein H6563_03020 [Lewinellaceae bacterium]|nr:hypothetical protein [Lewinellaceae bacterium]
MLTIATGKPYYIQLGINLARSFLLWNKGNEIGFEFVTDNRALIPSDLKPNIDIIDIPPGEFGEGFETKLYMDHFTQSRNTLFIDADCLIYRDLTDVFDRLKGNAVTAIGEDRTRGDFFGDIELLTKKLGLNYMPQFVGGIYYFELGEIAKKVFEYARGLKPRYDELELVRLRGKENEEPLIALGMAKYDQHAFPEDGSIKADRMFFHQMQSNVLSGRVRFWNNGEAPKQAYFQIPESRPAIGHFNASFSENYEYLSEEVRLNITARKIPQPFIEAYVFILFYFPGKVREILKKQLRPLYHALFGVRKVKTTKRVVD